MDISNQEAEFSVSEISNHIKNIVESNFSAVAIRGEISGLTLHQASGHMYMTLKDENSSIKATCWKFAIPKLEITPEEGMEVIATGKITTYDKNSSYQLNISNIKHAGLGALLKQLEDRKKKLSAEGLFDDVHKKPIPTMPKSIGVITSPTGAVIHDIIHRISERFPTPILLYPTKVQGDGARNEIVKAIEFFNNPTGDIAKPDLIIVARGGGSIEDLWEFNSEEIARAVFASQIPIISAVGHEPDYTIIDYVADLRAPTPTASAELAVPVKKDIEYTINDLNNRLNLGLTNRLNHNKLILDNIINKTPDLKTFVNNKSQKLNETLLRKNHSMQNIFSNKTNKAKNNFALLESYSFKKTLDRGFSIVFDDKNNVIKSTDKLTNDQDVSIQMADGKINAKIKK